MKKEIISAEKRYQIEELDDGNVVFTVNNTISKFLYSKAFAIIPGIGMGLLLGATIGFIIHVLTASLAVGLFAFLVLLVLFSFLLPKYVIQYDQKRKYTKLIIGQSQLETTKSIIPLSEISSVQVKSNNGVSVIAAPNSLQGLATLTAVQQGAKHNNHIIAIVGDKEIPLLSLLTPIQAKELFPVIVEKMKEKGCSFT